MKWWTNRPFLLNPLTCSMFECTTCFIDCKALQTDRPLSIDLCHTLIESVMDGQCSFFPLPTTWTWTKFRAVAARSPERATSRLSSLFFFFFLLCESWYTVSWVAFVFSLASLFVSGSEVRFVPASRNSVTSWHRFISLLTFTADKRLFVQYVTQMIGGFVDKCLHRFTYIITICLHTVNILFAIVYEQTK